MTSDRRHRPDMFRVRLAILVCVAACSLGLLPVAASARPQGPAAGGTQVSGERAAAGQTSETEHSAGMVPVIARLVNFALLAGILGYFLKTPLTGYLASRGSEIRQDLVTAAEMRQAAASQIERIKRKLSALPAELDALKARGAEDVRAERDRITAAVAGERERLLEQTRREIEMRLRIARRELIEHAADRAIEVADTRIRRSMTPEDHLRLVDRYTTQLEEAR